MAGVCVCVCVLGKERGREDTRVRHISPSQKNENQKTLSIDSRYENNTQRASCDEQEPRETERVSHDLVSVKEGPSTLFGREIDRYLHHIIVRLPYIDLDMYSTQFTCE